MEMECSTTESILYFAVDINILYDIILPHVTQNQRKYYHNVQKIINQNKKIFLVRKCFIFYLLKHMNIIRFRYTKVKSLL